MIPILVEPTCICFDYAIYNLHFCSDTEKHKEFAIFLRKLSQLFKDLSINKLSIALTKELYELYMSMIPSIAYHNASIQKNAMELYCYLLLKNSKLIPNINIEEDSIIFDSSLTDTQGFLYNTEVYTIWRKLSHLIVKNILPALILKSESESVFFSNYTNIRERTSDEVKVLTNSSVSIISNSDKIVLIKYIIENRDNTVTEDSVSCSGTGTHSSMWDKKISKLKDIPEPERILLKKIITTKLVKAITFLDFPNKVSAVSPPIIEIKDVEPKENADILHCILKGCGVKQNSQNICIEVVKGSGRVISNACNRRLSIEDIEDLFAFVENFANLEVALAK